jgi:hypothetical protein
MALADNTTWCAAQSCLTSNGGVTAETKAAADGTIYGLNSAHVLFTYTLAQGWVDAPSALQTAGGNAILHISVASASQVLALSAASSPANNVFVLNSAGTAWKTLATAEWLSVAELGPDGSIWGFNASGQIYDWNGSAWTAVPGSLSNISNAGLGNVWGVSTSSVLSSWNGTSFAAVSTPFTPYEAADAISVVGETSVAALDSSGGIHVSTNAGQNWSTILGTASSITGAGARMFTRDSSGTSYHVNLIVPALTITGSGYYPMCAYGHCPPGSLHTMTVKAWFGGKGGANGVAGVTVTSPTTNPATWLTTSATETGANCDPFFGSPGDPSCGGDYSGSAICSEMGDLGGGSGGNIPAKYGVATTGAKWLGAGQDGTLLGGAVYCNAGQYCSSSTTPPLCTVKSPVYINHFGQTGTPDQLCALHAAWAEEIPYGSFTFPSGIQTYCSPVADVAVPLGPTAPAVSCTTQP